ncbi:MAG: amino acid adenylation domain-containing protein [Spirochaetales bacterium]|nr:amino acid adenylation domain-containing protein [Spirochaetales bacterium]
MGNSPEKRIKLSPVQEQFWLQYQSHPEGSAYNMASLFEISGTLKVDAVRRALEEMIDRHEILRTRFVSDRGVPEQVIDPGQSLNWEEKDYSEESLSRDVETPFDLEKGPLCRFVLYRKGTQCLLLFVFHHLVIDLRSKEIFGEEFSRLYNRFSRGEQPDGPLPPQYGEYVAWFEDFSQSERYRRMEQHWQGTGLLHTPLNLSCDFERPSLPGTGGTRLSGKFTMDTFQGLHAFCAQENSSPFLVLLAAYYLLLHKYSGQESVSVGIPRTNRYEDLFRDTMGCFVNNLPMVIDFKEDMTFRQILERVRKEMLLVHRNQYVPYLRVISQSGGGGDRKYNPLFQTGFTSEPPMELNLDGLGAEPLLLPGHGSQLDLFLYFWERNGVFHWELEYNTDLFTETRALLFVSSYRTLLRQIIKGDDFPLARADWLSDRWRRKVCLDWNSTEREEEDFTPVHRLFEERVRETPDSTALIFKGEKLSYAELNRRANGLAHLLREKGAGGETIVGLSVERSFEMVIGLLGILKAGASYMPMEPTHPGEYKQYLVEDTSLKFLLTKRAYREELNALFPELDLILLDGEENLSREENPEVSIGGDNRAYLFYTSGSTGKPKGVEVEHRGLTDRIQWMDRTFRFGKDRKTLLKTPYNFDVSGMEFWLPLTTGAPLVIAEPEGHLDNSYLAEVIRGEDISVVHFVPSLLNTFLGTADGESCPSLMDVLCCGEALPPSVVNEFYRKFPNGRLHNLYGPTEATIFITYWDCEKDSSFVPIGRPVSHCQVYILDDHLRPVPPGVTGHLYLAGSGLARGYYGREELTGDLFVPHFEEPHRLMYRSGDLAQWSPEGDVIYLGRSDNQVQLHGQRIELGEVESALNSHEHVDSSAVIVEGEFGSEQRLVAYVVRKDEAVQADQLRAHILKSSPKYMVPSLFCFLEELPLSPNGKLDRKALPQAEQAGGDGDRPKPPIEGDLEQEIAALWQDILKVPLGGGDSFFDLGGTSLQIMEMQRELVKKLNRDIPVARLFQYTTVDALADYLRRQEGEGDKNRVLQRAGKQRKAKMKRVRLS